MAQQQQILLPTVTEKTGFEITVLGVSITSGEGTKTYNSPQTNADIATDFQSAGTDSVYASFSASIGGTVSGSTSGVGHTPKPRLALMGDYR
jgi:hypothetical protein